MRAVIQRVSRASVTLSGEVVGEVVGEIGVGLLVVLVPSVISRGVFGDASSSAIFIGWIAGLVAALVAPPVISIGYALLYFDLRHRREDFGFDVMEKELALATVGGAFESTQSGPTGAGQEAGYEEGGS